MKALYFDCINGISGDMVLGAFADAGVGLSFLKQEIAKLGIKGIEIKKRRVLRGGIAAVRIDVGKEPHPSGRSIREIFRIIERSRLPKAVKALSKEIFENIADAESKVHRVKKAELHLHEVGGVDSIVDIVGAAVCVKKLGIKRFFSSKLRFGRGFARGHSGRIPIPAPASVNLLKGVPVEFTERPFELITPTGAGILKTLVKDFGAPPEMKISSLGYGAGTRNPKEFPNLLRIIIGETAPAETDDVTVAETNIDDMSPVLYEYLIEKLLKAGALDVYLTSVIMKKSRPGVLVTVLLRNEDLDRIIEIIFEETTTFGVRYRSVSRRVLDREFSKVNTEYGAMRVKVGRLQGKIKQVSPEYEDCKRLAVGKGAALRKVMEAGNKHQLLLIPWADEKLCEY